MIENQYLHFPFLEPKPLISLESHCFFETQHNFIKTNFSDYNEKERISL